MPTLKKSIKAVRDALKEAMAVEIRALEHSGRNPEHAGSQLDCQHCHKLSGRLEGLRLARRILDQEFPQ